jgi:5-methylthioadenosine/S-adenosylhomocysteine deaminase
MSNDSLNLFEAMKLAAMLPAVRDPDPERWLSARQALGMATAGGARSGRIAGIGAIAVGARADLVLLDLRRAPFAPRNDLVRQAVYADAGSSVDTVLVDGRVVVEGGRVLTVDEAAVAAAALRGGRRGRRGRAGPAGGARDRAPGAAPLTGADPR